MQDDRFENIRPNLADVQNGVFHRLSWHTASSMLKETRRVKSLAFCRINRLCIVSNPNQSVSAGAFPPKFAKRAFNSSRYGYTWPWLH